MNDLPKWSLVTLQVIKSLIQSLKNNNAPGKISCHLNFPEYIMAGSSTGLFYGSKETLEMINRIDTAARIDGNFVVQKPAMT